MVGQSTINVTKGNWKRHSPVAYFTFGIAPGNTSYQMIDDLGALVRPDDFVLCATGSSYDDFGVRTPPNFNGLESTSNWLAGKNAFGILKTLGTENIQECADWIATNPFGARFSGVMTAWEKNQNNPDYIDPLDDAVEAPIAMLEFHQNYRAICDAAGTEFWSMPGGLNLQDFIWEDVVQMPYGATGAICHGYIPQFQGSLKDETLDKFYIRMMDDIKAADNYPLRLLPQMVTLGPTLLNATMDVDLAISGSTYMLHNGSDGICIQYELQQSTYDDALVPYMERLPYRR